jgi:hypothetical protein
VGGIKMKIISLINEYGITENKVYVVLFEYNSVYEIELDNGNIGCRAKNFFEVL